MSVRGSGAERVLSAYRQAPRQRGEGASGEGFTKQVGRDQESDSQIRLHREVGPTGG